MYLPTNTFYCVLISDVIVNITMNFFFEDCHINFQHVKYQCDLKGI